MRQEAVANIYYAPGNNALITWRIINEGHLERPHAREARKLTRKLAATPLQGSRWNHCKGNFFVRQSLEDLFVWQEGDKGCSLQDKFPRLFVFMSGVVSPPRLCIARNDLAQPPTHDISSRCYFHLHSSTQYYPSGCATLAVNELNVA